MENKMMGCAVLAFGLMFLVLNASGSPSNDISCRDAITDLLPCKSFLVGSGPASPTAACCLGAETATKQLLATTTETRKAVCECIHKWGRDVGANPENGNKIREFCKTGLSPCKDVK
ncbi:hypothetical protein FH972_000103 [Carpinus fangiana]|uniref:Bifunctional inhibitor/plant lipid transfer protein/seed storage helical domain-containing protein n=1 Tax=Carpinus fangiana TaxID=176857 RepID=A0A5N6Q7T7_9ROSI|nr:hypothetical protein FH972_000103 [Carpinus fangiana]